MTTVNRWGNASASRDWAGPNCEVLDLQSVGRLNKARVPSAIFFEQIDVGGVEVSCCDSTTQLYHMYASELVLGCGLYYWFTNSRVVHAVSKQIDGPYENVKTKSSRGGCIRT
mmetsp:Transcript_24834/g.58947  ORF Transcript_24834/g.58947 Transcript_24834/m.58947 type:complete len:113 (-) Transcript_24834:309-647(-)